MGSSPNPQNRYRTEYFPRPGMSYAYSASSLPPSAIPHDRMTLPLFGSRRRPYPPPVSVEDEADSLAREHGSVASDRGFDEEPPSRGDVEQQPIMLEVHEHNPERRFVILNDSPNAPVESAQARNAESRAHKANEMDEVDKHKANAGKGYEPTEHRQRPRADSANPELDRPRIRPDLPPLDVDARRPPEHYRSRSTAAADASRPDYFSSRQSRPHGDQLLSPDVIADADVVDGTEL
ncbi:hypothetical protein CDD83_1274 [Cordyceps sp. RAO-2017]|nr:hypothetical protein CDD83_1274 [Cordyceps sp. RAO-2017]